jgi:hypothetical protein
MLFPTWLTLSTPPHLCSNATSSKKPSLTTLSQTVSASFPLHLALLFPLCTYKYLFKTYSRLYMLIA